MKIHSKSYSIVVGFLNKTRQKKALFTAMVLIIIGVVAGVILWTYQSHSKQHTNMQSPVPTAYALQVAENDIQHQMFNAAQQELANAQDVNNPNVLRMAAEAAIGSRNYNKALQFDQQIQKRYGLDYNLAVSLGEVEQDLGNPQEASSYYQQAINFIQQDPSKVPNSSQTIAGLQSLIQGINSQ